MGNILSNPPNIITRCFRCCCTAQGKRNFSSKTCPSFLTSLPSKLNAAFFFLFFLPKSILTADFLVCFCQTDNNLVKTFSMIHYEAFDFIRFLSFELIKSADLLRAHFSYSMTTGYLSYDFIFLHSWLSPVTAVWGGGFSLTDLDQRGGKKRGNLRLCLNGWGLIQRRSFKTLCKSWASLGSLLKRTTPSSSNRTRSSYSNERLNILRPWGTFCLSDNMAKKNSQKGMYLPH